MLSENIKSVQELIPVKEILEKGIIILDNKKYIKIIKIIPINYNLKTELEKKGILDSYKTFLKSCNFEIQILIHSNKQNLEEYILKIKEKVKRENNYNLNQLSEKYIKFIKRINIQKNAATKSFFIVIKSEGREKKECELIKELNDKFLIIKDCLTRCGNEVKELEKKEDVKNIFISYFKK